MELRSNGTHAHPKSRVNICLKPWTVNEQNLFLCYRGHHLGKPESWFSLSTIKYYSAHNHNTYASNNLCLFILLFFYIIRYDMFHWRLSKCSGLLIRRSWVPAPAPPSYPCWALKQLYSLCSKL